MRRFSLSFEHGFARPDTRLALTVALLLLAPSCDNSSPDQQNDSAGSLEDGANQASGPSAVVTAEGAFSSASCMEQHFPAAQVMTPPPEVRFYCAAPWNGSTFAQLNET